MADEQNVVETWLHSVLNDPDDPVLPTAVPGGFWKDGLPQMSPDGVGVTYPAGRFSLISGVDLMVHNTIRVWNNQLWLIVVTAPAGADSTLSDAVSRVDDLLHGQGGIEIAPGAHIQSCAREQIVSLPVTEPGGTEYRQRGGQYRIKVTAAD